MGALSPAFRGAKEGQFVLHGLAVSRVTLIQNNHYVTLAYFGATFPKPHDNTVG